MGARHPQRPYAARMLGTHMANGHMLAGGCVLFGASAFMSLVIDARGFSPGWYDPLNTLLVTTAFLGPLALGLATWEIQALKRSGITVLSDATPAGNRKPVLLSVTSCMAWALASLALAGCVLSVRGTALSFPTVPGLLLFSLAAAVLLASTALGAAAGWLFDNRLVAPAAAVGTFVWMYAVSYVDGWLGRLSPIDPATFYRVFLEPRSAVLVKQLGICVGILVVATAAFAARRFVSGMLGLVGCAIIATSVALLATGGAATTQFREPPRPMPCLGERPQVCVWPNHEGELPDIRRAVRLVQSATAGALPMPSVYSEPGLLDHRHDGLGVLSLPDGDAPFEVYLDSAVGGSLPQPACPTDGSSASERSWDAVFDLGEWVRARMAASGHSAPYGLRASIVELAKGPIVEQRAWVARKVAAVRQCHA